MSVPTKSSEAGIEESVLPPGQRDESGFWYPSGYSDPSTLVRPRRRRRKDGSGGPKGRPAGANGAERVDH